MTATQNLSTAANNSVEQLTVDELLAKGNLKLNPKVITTAVYTIEPQENAIIVKADTALAIPLDGTDIFPNDDKRLIFVFNPDGHSITVNGNSFSGGIIMLSKTEGIVLLESGSGSSTSYWTLDSYTNLRSDGNGNGIVYADANATVGDTRAIVLVNQSRVGTDSDIAPDSRGVYIGGGIINTLMDKEQIVIGANISSSTSPSVAYGHYIITKGGLAIGSQITQDDGSNPAVLIGSNITNDAGSPYGQNIILGSNNHSSNNFQKGIVIGDDLDLQNEKSSIVIRTKTDNMSDTQTIHGGLNNIYILTGNSMVLGTHINNSFISGYDHHIETADGSLLFGHGATCSLGAMNYSLNVGAGNGASNSLIGTAMIGEQNNCDHPFGTIGTLLVGQDNRIKDSGYGVISGAHGRLDNFSGIISSATANIQSGFIVGFTDPIADGNSDDFTAYATVSNEIIVDTFFGGKLILNAWQQNGGTDMGVATYDMVARNDAGTVSAMVSVARNKTHTHTLMNNISVSLITTSHGFRINIANNSGHDIVCSGQIEANWR